MTYFLLILSCLVNIVFLFYSRWLITVLKNNEEETIIIQENIQEYTEHLSSVHEMQMFYGDPTLMKLIEHGKELTKKISEFNFILNEQTEEAQEDERVEQ